MLRTTISKLRQVCALTFVPRLLRGDIRYAPDRFERLSVCVQRRVDKSTNSSKQDQEDCERCQRIIDRAFAPNPSYSDVVDMEMKHKESFVNMVSPEVPTSPENQCEKCQRIIKEIFGEENAGDRKRETVDPVYIPLTELQATTAKENAETLEQKIERIDETPLVEAPVKSKVEGFNVQPKVFGNRKKRRIGERISMLHFSSDKSVHGRRKGGNVRKDGSFDELAKRCLDSPSSHIDERLLKEMEKLGVPPTTRRGSRRTANDAGIVQPEIMRRPRRPVAKTELDFLMMRKARLLRLNSDLPPPFELTPVKTDSINLVCFSDTHDNALCYERIPPLKEQILIDTVAMSDDAKIESLNPVYHNEENMTRTEERPPQQLLGHMTAAVMSDESNVMNRSSEMEQLVNRQEQQFEDETPKTRSMLRHEDEKISLSKLKELENEHDKVISREKLASAHILSELVDPKEISPRPHSSGMIKEEIEMLKNLLRTRVEYLTQEKIKRLYPKDFPCTEDAPEVGRVAMKEFTETEVNDTLQQLGVDQLRIEKVKPHHLKEDLNIISKETSPHTEPGVMIKECTDAHPMREEVPTMLKSYSQKQEMVTPHQLFEELAIISRETEIGVLMDDLSEINHDFVSPDKSESFHAPHKGSTPGQLIDNVGMISKNSSPTFPGPTETKGPHITLAQKFDPTQPLIDPYDKRCHSYECDEYDSYTFEALTKEEKREESRPERIENAVHSCSEMRPLQEEPEDPVMAVEMGRLPCSNNQCLTDHKPMAKPTAKEPVRDSPHTTEGAREMILNPLLNRGTVAHVETQKVHENVYPSTSTIPTDMNSMNMPKERTVDKPIPLSEMLKRVRERNRLQFCKQFEVRMAGPEVEPVVGECGKKHPPCPPPAPTCPPPPPKPCPPPKPPCPNPCKPKCPPTCPPSTCEPKPKCPPPKKSPCEKFKTCKCSNIKIQDALTLLLYLGPQFHIPQKSLLPFLACSFNSLSNPTKKESDVVKRAVTHLHNLCTLVLVASIRDEIGALESAVTGKASTDFAKTYDPWTPIPSWPIPVKEEKRQLVCPKDGCKVIPPKLNAPCRDINPCINFPKKHFSIIDFLTVVLGQPKKKMVYDIGEF